jgi:hypothetical protein
MTEASQLPEGIASTGDASKPRSSSLKSGDSPRQPLFETGATAHCERRAAAASSRCWRLKERF